MGRNCLVNTHWKILSAKTPRCVNDVFDTLLEIRHLDQSAISGELKDLEPHLASMRGMEEGARLMADHMAAGHKIVLVGDYDCDGITSIAQMALFLNDIGYRNYAVVIPLREEGYGIPERAIRENADAGLLVAMDCGTLDFKPVELARSRGADCIVIDHHQVPAGKLAPATVLINPKHPECRSPFKEFCSSGLTLLFLAALRRALRDSFPSPSLGGKYMALAAIGTVADLVPLVSANRILARSGLNSLNGSCWPPVSLLADCAGLSRKSITAGHISYYIGPRINAAGRVSDGRIAYDLLTGSRPEELSRLAGELNRLNAERQAQEDRILKSIRSEMAEKPVCTRTFVSANSKWPAGVVGIAASRVQQEIHYGPVIILSVDENSLTARGSGRSVPGFDIHQALERCSDLLLKWGGHKMAAGLTIRTDLIPEFAARFEQTALEYPAEIFEPCGRVDMELPLGLVGSELMDALRSLEPHGMGNPAPVFAFHNARFTVKKAFGKERNHFRLGFGNGLEGVFWRGTQRRPDLAAGSSDCTDLVFQVEWDHFNGRPSLNVKDMGDFFHDRRPA